MRSWYAEEFESRPPHDVGPAAYTWLSRGLYEALVDYVQSADQDTALRIVTARGISS